MNADENEIKTVNIMYKLRRDILNSSNYKYLVSKIIYSESLLDKEHYIDHLCSMIIWESKKSKYK